MANISAIKLPNGNTYNIVDKTSGYITVETDPIFSASPAAGISSSDITAWNNKSDFSGSYNDLTDKPTIPTIPTNVSAFTNDAGYLTTHQSIKTINSTSMVGSGNVDIQKIVPVYASNLNSVVSGTSAHDIVVHDTDENTLNTPYKAGMTDATKGICITVAITEGYWTQTFIPYASIVSFQRYGTPGSWVSNWSKVATEISQTVTTTVADWNASTTCTKSVTGVTASNNVVVTPAPASIADWQSAGVYCSAQGSGTLTFTCASTPSASITVNVLVIN